ncbi:hypothetical protein BC940DRAFT_308745 [Gongronella butleri]|nr:hypothetical protein BC940DRAFT_308745 [Gongronella butleri]
MADTQQQASTSARATISRGVVFKLLFFSALLFAAPILTFVYSIDTIFDGNTTYAAGAAALMANLVVIAYIISAMREDMNENKDLKKD